MISLVVKAPSGFMRTSLLVSSTIGRQGKISQIVRRWSSSQAGGASPSQLPVPGEPGWMAFVANVERYNRQAPLSPADLQQGQELYKLGQKIEKIEKRIEEMCSKILKSNR